MSPKPSDYPLVEPAERTNKAGANVKTMSHIRHRTRWAAWWAVVSLATTSCGGSPSLGEYDNSHLEPATGVTIVETDATASSHKAGSHIDASRADEAIFQGEYIPRIVGQYPHDSGAYTQGLEWYGSALLESTGRYGQSTLRLVEPKTGEVIQTVSVAANLFAEGVTVIDGVSYQLTWKSGTLLTTNLSEFAPAYKKDAYSGQGWGLCYDGSQLVMSNGSSTLQFRDPQSFELLGEVTVHDDGMPIGDINELECVGNQVWANVWLTNSILAINPNTGDVEATIDASSLAAEAGMDADEMIKTGSVLNGIAFHRETERFWITGKLWPAMFEIELQPKP